ncbi:MAG: Hpt domain-containing protein [Vicinamibacterales bacterium]|nr:Hpt domain-containing protein [Vicinamibacterales bacterium]
MSGLPVLDHATLDRLRELNEPGEPDIVIEVLTLFLEDAPARVAAVAAAQAAGDARGLERAAHGLKGSAGNIGALRLQALCHRIEDLGRLEEAGDPMVVLSLHEEFETLRQEVTRLL